MFKAHHKVQTLKHDFKKLQFLKKQYLFNSSYHSIELSLFFLLSKLDNVSKEIN
jgi:hypothetical protein